MNERDLQNLLREMRDEPVPADSLARVRAGVEQRIDHKPWLSAWKIVAALVMVGCIVAGFVLLRPTRTPVPIQQPRQPEIAQVLVPPVETSVRTTPRPRRTRHRPAKVEPVLIRIETPDPEVVILLVN